MSSPKEIYETAMGGYQAALIEEQAAFQKAQLTGDFAEQVRASQEMASLRVQANEYHRMANEHVASMQQQPQGNKFGLSEREVEIAHDLSRGADDLTNEKREQIYYENKRKLADMRARGVYPMPERN